MRGGCMGGRVSVPAEVRAPSLVCPLQTPAKGYLPLAAVPLKFAGCLTWGGGGGDGRVSGPYGRVRLGFLRERSTV